MYVRTFMSSGVVILVGDVCHEHVEAEGEAEQGQVPEGEVEGDILQ